MNNKKVVAIIGAMDCEIGKIIDNLQNVRVEENKNFKIYKGEFKENTYIVLKCGVGKVNAALNTQYIIDKYNPEFILNTGIAGGINPDLNIYDIVVGEKLLQHDFDATALGYAKGYMCNGIKPDEPTIYYSDKELIKLFTEAYAKLDTNSKIVTGTIATGDMFVSSNEKKKELRELFNADAAEMEAASIAQTANLNSVPCLVIRIIADLADENASELNKATEKELGEHSAKTISSLL